MKLGSIVRTGLVAAGLLAGVAGNAFAQAGDTIKVGILHSLSGTMAISETTLKDVMLMLIEQQNKKGGLLGKKLEAVVVDPASNWPLFAEKARELLQKDKVAAVFGCWTSVSRKSVLPVFEELNGILFYPVQYEGQESQRNVFYTGAAPNQQAIPAVDYLMSKDGGEVKRWVLAGTDYVYPRTTNKILEAYLLQKGVAKEDIMINYTPFGHSDWQSIVADIKKFGTAGKKTAVVSTINGDANVPFYKELGNQGIKAKDIPVVAFSVGEEELAGVDTKPLVGHLAAWNYFQSIKTPANTKFIADWQADGWPSHESTHTVVESYGDGWAWSVPLAPGRRQCTVMIDPALTHVGRDGLDAEYRREIAKTRGFADRLSQARQLSRAWSCDSTIYQSVRCADTGLLLVGDAASFVEPLSSAGVRKAIISAWRAAVVVNTSLRHPDMASAASGFFEERERHMFSTCLMQAGEFFAAATREHDTPFWRTRAASRALAEPGPAGEAGGLLAPTGATREVFERLRTASSTRFAAGRLLQFGRAPEIEGRELVMREGLVLGGEAGPVVFAGGIELAVLTRLALQSDDVDSLIAQYEARAGRVSAQELLGALSQLVAAGILVEVGEGRGAVCDGPELSISGR